MPAATTTTIAPEPPQAQVWYRPTGDKVLEPFSSPITAAEHKIRNLEKRKLKLDQYRNEQAEGKTLNADQLAAVSKYNEVIQQLEHNRELVSCLRQVHQQTIKFIKQELRREFAERNKFILALQSGLGQMENPMVQQDFLMGENGAQKLPSEDLVELNELSKVLKPSLRDTDFAGKLETASDVISKLYESRGKINNRPSQQVKAAIDAIIVSQYFASTPAPSVPINNSEEVSPRSPENLNPAHVPEVPLPNQNAMPTQMMVTPQDHHEMSYVFMQESQVEIESPHMDPAVVAVSSFVPPPPQIQSQQPDSNHVFQPTPTESLNNIQGGIRDLNINQLNSNNLEEEEDWEEKVPAATYNNSSAVNGNVEVGGEDNNTNGYDRRGGSFRGRRGGGGRGGRGNGFGNSRPPKNPRGGGSFNNSSRYFRADRIGDGEPGEFRGGKSGRGGYAPRSFKGNGNASATAGGPPRRGRGGPPKPYNGIHEARSAE